MSQGVVKQTGEGCLDYTVADKLCRRQTPLLSDGRSSLT